MIVEFLGVSGVGKTTFAGKYKADLERVGTKVLWPAEGLYTKYGWFSRNFRKALVVVHFTAGHLHWVLAYRRFVLQETESSTETRKLLFNGIYLKSLLSNVKNDHQIYLFDEGVLQHYWALKLRSGKEVFSEQLTQLLSFFRWPDQVISVEADAKTIEGRIRVRGEYVRIMDNGDLIDTIMKMQHVQEDIIRCVQNKVVIHRVNNA